MSKFMSTPEMDDAALGVMKNLDLFFRLNQIDVNVAYLAMTGLLGSLSVQMAKSPEQAREHVDTTAKAIRDQVEDILKKHPEALGAYLMAGEPAGRG